MRKLLLLMLVLFLLTSCSGTVTEDTSDLVAEAVALFESGKLLPALDLALEAPEYTDCQRIIAHVTGAYRNGVGLLSKSLTLPDTAVDLALSEDGAFLAVSSGTALYLADYDKAELVATLPDGDFWFADGILYVVGEEKHAYDMQGTELDIDIKEKPIGVCEADGRSFSVGDGRVTDGVWSRDYELAEGYLNIFPLDHETYNSEGDVVTYNSVVVANGRRLTAFDRKTGETVFDTELSDDIITCTSGDGVVIIGTTKMLSAGGELFSNKANNPLFPEGDTLRLSDTYKFGDKRQASAYANGRIATVAVESNEVELLYKVSYDTHRKLSLDVKYPTAVCDHDGILAVGTYEYIDGKRHNWFVEYDLANDSYTKTEIEHTVEDIYYADGWQIIGEGRTTAIGGTAQYKTQPKILAGTDIEYGKKTVTLPIDSSVLTDSEGNTVDIGFSLNGMSEISYADGDTLFITEYRYSGKAVLVSMSDMKIKAEVENGIYFVKSADAILYVKGGVMGLYEYLGKGVK